MIAVGCGSGNHTTTTSPSPGGGSPSPSGANGGGGGNGGGSGSGGGSSSTVFQAVVLQSPGLANVLGNVIVAQNGAGTLSLAGLVANTPHTFNFCPFLGNRTCSNIASFTTDANGAVNLTFQMSKGTFAGVFQVQQNGTDVADSNFEMNIPKGVIYNSQLVEYPNTSTAPFGGGDVNVAGSVVHIDVKGATPNTTVGIGYCANTGGSSCFFLQGETTDANGNGSWDVDLSKTLGNYNAPGAFTVVIGTSGTAGALSLASGFIVQ